MRATAKKPGDGTSRRHNRREGRRERVARGWTIRKLAQRAGLNHQYLGVVEAGLNVPSLSLIMEVCEVLGADAGAMIREVAEARKKPGA